MAAGCAGAFHKPGDMSDNAAQPAIVRQRWLREGETAMIGLRMHVVAAALAVALPLAAGPASAAAPALTHLKMLYQPISGFIAGYVAEEQGIFAKHGLDVTFIATQSSGNNPPALVSGSVEVAGPTVPTVLEANDAGLDLVIFAGSTVYPLPGDAFLARPAAHIEKPADLVGKTVGVPGLGALLDFMLRRNLKENGVDPSKVRFVELGFPQAADALRSGRIDAYPSETPFTARIEQSGAGVPVPNWFGKTPDDTVTTVYAATRKWAEAHKDTVAAFRAALKEAYAYMATHKAETNAALAKYTHLPVAVVAVTPLAKIDTDITPAQVKFWIDVMQDQGALKHTLDPAKMLFQP
jgi:NitT/TauT family transport system substrate-binding protein